MFQTFQVGVTRKTTVENLYHILIIPLKGYSCMLNFMTNRGSK